MSEQHNKNILKLISKGRKQKKAFKIEKQAKQTFASYKLAIEYIQKIVFISETSIGFFQLPSGERHYIVILLLSDRVNDVFVNEKTSMCLGACRKV